MPDWKALRSEFPLLDRCIYLNACSLGPLPTRDRDALARATLLVTLVFLAFTIASGPLSALKVNA